MGKQKTEREKLIEKYGYKGGQKTGDGTIKNVGQFNSQYDIGITKDNVENLEDFRAEKQPLTHRWANGLTKGVANTGIRVVDSFVTGVAALTGAVDSAIKASQGEETRFNDFINNPVSQALDELSEKLGEELKVYRTDEYNNAGIGKLMYGGTFWADTMTDAASFMASSLVGGGIAAKGIGAIGKSIYGANLASKAGNLLQGTKAALDTKRGLNFAQSVGASTFGALAESGIEARETYKTIYGKLLDQKRKQLGRDLNPNEIYDIEKTASAASNFSFATNMLLVGGSNILQFGKYFAGYSDDVVKTANIVNDGLYKGQKYTKEIASKAQKAYRALGYLADPITEGGQEASQFLTSKYLENYYTGDDETRNNRLTSFIEGFKELDSEEGIESILAGFVLGGIGSGFKAVKGEKDTDSTDESIALANSLDPNEVLSNTTKILLEQQSRADNAANALLGATMANDEQGYKVIQQTAFADFVTSRARIGKFEDVITLLESVKNTEIEELDKSLSELLPNEGDKDALADSLIEQAKEINSKYQKNLGRYSSFLSQEDLTKLTVIQSVYDKSVQNEKDVIEQFKQLNFVDIKQDIIEKYINPKEYKNLLDQKNNLRKEIDGIRNQKSNLKSDDPNLEASRQQLTQNIEQKSNELNDILKTLEESLNDFEGENEIVNETAIRKNYRTQINRELNRRLNNLKELEKREPSQKTKRQEVQELIKQFNNIQDVKDDLVDLQNKYTDPELQKEREDFNRNIDKKKSDAYLDQLFTVKDSGYKVSEGVYENNPLKIEKGLYYSRRYDKKAYNSNEATEAAAVIENTEKNKEEKPVNTVPTRGRRDFIEVIDTFIEADESGKMIPKAEIKQGSETKVVPVSSLSGFLRKAVTKGDPNSYDLMTAEEAFYVQYKDRVIKYQYQKEIGQPPVVVYGMLNHNEYGTLVLSYYDEKTGNIEDTTGLYNPKEEKYQNNTRFRVTNNYNFGSQYLEILSEAETERHKEKVTFQKVLRDKETRLQKVNTEYESLNQEAVKSAYKRYTNELNKIIERLENSDLLTPKQLSNLYDRIEKIGEYLESLKTNISTIPTIIRSLEEDIAQIQGQQEALLSIKDIKNEELALTYKQELEELKASKEQFSDLQKSLSDTYGMLSRSLGNIKKRFDKYIDLEGLYNNSELLEIARTYPLKDLAVKFENQSLTEQDIIDLLRFAVNNNNKTLSYNTVNQNGTLATNSTKVLIKAEVLNNVFKAEASSILEGIKEISENTDEAVENYAQTINSLYNAKNNQIALEVKKLLEYEINTYKGIVYRLSNNRSDVVQQQTEFQDSEPYVGEEGEDAVVTSPKPSFGQGYLKSIAPNTLVNYPSNGTNRDKQYWAFAKFMDNYDPTEYAIEYFTEGYQAEDGVISFQTTEQETQLKENSDKYPIWFRIVDKKTHEPIRIDTLGKISSKGNLHAISSLEAATLKTESGLNRFQEQDKRDEILAKEEKDRTEDDKRFVELVEEEERRYVQTLREYRKKIIEGDSKVYDVIGNNVGIPVATGETVDLEQVIGENVFEQLDKPNSEYSLEIAKSNTLLLPNGREFPVKKGNVYLVNKKSSKVYFTDIGKVGTSQANYIIEQISNFFNANLIGSGNITWGQFYNTVNSVIHWGYNTYKDEKAGRKRPYIITFKKGTNNSVVQYGKWNDKGYSISEVSVENLQNKSDGYAEFNEFLKTLRLNISSKTLEDKKKFNIAKDNIKVRINSSNKVQFKSAYIIPSVNPAEKPKVVKKQEAKQQTILPIEESIETIEKRFKSNVYEYTEQGKKTLESLGVRKSLENLVKVRTNLLNTVETIQSSVKGEVFNVDKLDAKQQNNYNQMQETLDILNTIIDNGGLKTEGNFIAAFEAIYANTNNIKVNEELKTVETVQDTDKVDIKVEKKRENRKGRKRGEKKKSAVTAVSQEQAASAFPSNSKKEEDDTFFMKVSEELKREVQNYDIPVSEIIKERNVDIKKIKDKYNVAITTTKKLIDGVGYGKLSVIADNLSNPYKIEISDQAPRGTIFHEEFHLVERAMLTSEQRRTIYTEYNRQQGTKMSDKDTSEALAEEYRHYVLERKYDESLNPLFAFFKKVVEAIKDFLAYKRNPKIQNLFKDIYEDNLRQKLQIEAITPELSSSEVKAVGKGIINEYYRLLEEVKVDGNSIDLLKFYTNRTYANKAKKAVLDYINSFLGEGETPYTESEFTEAFHEELILRVQDYLEDTNTAVYDKLNIPENAKKVIDAFKKERDLIRKVPSFTEDEIDINSLEATKDFRFDADMTNEDHISKVSADIKAVLSSIEGDKNFLGLKEPIPLAATIYDLHIDLLGIKTPTEMLTRLKNKYSQYAERGDKRAKIYAKLFNILTTDNDLSNSSKAEILSLMNLKNSFFQQFSKDYLNFQALEIKGKGDIAIIDENKETKINSELANLKYNIKTKSLKDFTSNVSKGHIGTLSSRISYIENIGFDLPVGFYEYLDSNKEDRIEFEKTVKKLTDYDLNTEFADNLIQESYNNPNKINNFRKIAGLIAKYRNENTALQVLSTDNKQMYAVTNKSYITKVLEDIENTEYTDPVEIEETKGLRNSNKVYFTSFNKNGDSQKSSKLLEYDALILHINNAVKNIAPFIFTGDKSSMIGFKNINKFKNNVSLEDKQALYKKILEWEYNEYQRDLGKEDVKISKYGYFNLTSSLFNNSKKDLPTFTEFYDAVKEGFNKNVETLTNSKEAQLTQKILGYGLIDNIDSNARDKSDNLSQFVADVNHFITEAFYLQAKYITGSFSLYKNGAFLKRVPSAMAAKMSSALDTQNIKIFNEYLNTEKIFEFEESDNPTFNTLIFNDVYHKSDLYKSPVNVADAQGFEHIESVRFRQIMEGIWTEQDERLYESDLRGELDVNTATHWTAEKTQYFGDQDLGDGSKNNTTFYKMSVLPITNSLAKSSKFYTNVKSLMEDKNITLLLADSANKVGRKTDNGKGYKLFNEEGEVNTEVNNELLQKSYWKFYNTQTTTKKEVKNKQITLTQAYKQIVANLPYFDNLTVGNEVRNPNEVIAKMDDLKIQRSILGKTEMLKSFGLKEEEEGNYVIQDRNKLLELIQSTSATVDVSSVELDTISRLLSTDKGLDILGSKGKYQAKLNSIINKRVIQPEVFGNSYAQVANLDTLTSLTYNKKGIKNEIPKKLGKGEVPLKAYVEGVSDYLEVKIPAPKDANGNPMKFSDFSHDERLLEAIGVRIPTQAPSFIDKIKIVGFLPSSYGNVIVVPAEITTKTGSDFDIDKLNVYLTNYKIVDGTPLYIKDDSIKGIDNQLLEEYKYILSSKEYRTQLLRETTDKDIKLAANETRALLTGVPYKGETILPDNLDYMFLSTMTEKKEQFEQGKQILGQAALHSTNHIEAQKADMRMKAGHPAFDSIKNLHPVNELKLGLFKNAESQEITDIISQYITASVDIVNDPYLTYMGVDVNLAGTQLMLARLGVPLKEIALFFNQPIIRKYVSEFKKESSVANRDFKSDNRIHKDIIAKYLKDNVKRVESMTAKSLQKSLTNEDPMSANQLSILKEFDRLYNMANHLNTAMQNTTFDTKGVPTSFGESIKVKNNYEDFLKANERINTPIVNFERIFERDGKQTYLGYFRDVVFESAQYFDKLFTSNSYKQFNSLKQEILGGLKKDGNFQRVHDLLIGDFATYIVTNNTDIIKEYDNLTKLKSQNNLGKRILEITRNPKHRLHNNLFLNALNVNPYESNNVLQLKNGANLNNLLIEDYKNSLLDIAEIDGQLAYDIVKMSIIQQGFSKSPIGYSAVIDPELYFNVVNTFYENTETPINIEDFREKFILNNYKQLLPRKGLKGYNKSSKSAYTVEESGDTRIKLDGQEFIISPTLGILMKTADGNIKKGNNRYSQYLDNNTYSKDYRSVTNVASPKIEYNPVNRMKELNIKNCN